MNTRLSMTVKNAFWSYISMIVTFALRFISRTVFINFLGSEYLGINGLFSSVLGVLSFAELGIGTAINFSLYKPVAQHNVEKIKSYMHYYKIAYRIVASVVCLLGLVLLPFLDFIVNNPGNIGDIRVYYLIFLFDTVISYFVSYKFSVAYAEQKGYLFTNINTIVSLVTVITQIVVLYVWKNYVFYLLISTAVNLIKNLIISKYLNRLYPYLKDKKITPLLKEEKTTLIKKVKALIIHKIGEVSVHQTDNIIISSFINVKTIGLISNYNLLISTVSSCISVLFNSVTGSLGNLVATENKEKQYEIFKIYRFVGFWFYGFTSIALYVLATPFIEIWLGKSMIVNDFVIGLIILNYYMIGHRICLNNIKTVGGVVEQDKYVALIQAIVNLVTSVILVNIIGLPGVYVGTVLQGLVSTIIKPIVVYKNMFGISSKYYFLDSLKYIAVVIIGLLPCLFFRDMLINYNDGILGSVVLMIITTIIPHLIFCISFYRSSEFKYILNTAKRLIRQKK